jgi:hypothetical protein
VPDCEKNCASGFGTSDAVVLIRYDLGGALRGGRSAVYLNVEFSSVRLRFRE